ncbi:Conserved_hypothetical protein [Hexamita inflata]|uniref:Microbial-type PARG catalytic domain-containing protein n=1 Tax=Hexamita inflata TaxID=28002 RepID=A0AA86QAU4_9EUKA|nr:Conserved hypothetical protein [Hexamita inflata]
MLQLLVEEQNSFEYSHTSEIVQQSLIDTAIRNQNQKIVILNDGNAYHPGGGLLNRQQTSEEQICRCSDLYGTLIQCIDQFYFYNSDILDSNDTVRAIVSKNYIFRDINLQFLENPVEVTIITCPSIITNQQLNRDRSLKLMKQRIDNIMTLIQSLNADVAIFGAFGCEGNSADPQFVAQCFKENINNNRCCKRNIFAIEADENVQAFKHVFESDN